MSTRQQRYEAVRPALIQVVADLERRGEPVRPGAISNVLGGIGMAAMRNVMRHALADGTLEPQADGTLKLVVDPGPPPPRPRY